MNKETLEKRYKEYFIDCFDFSIGDGWLFLIEILCSRIKNDEKKININIQYLNNFLSNSNENKKLQQELLKKLQEQKSFLIDYPFKILQIKEKFGSLRIYTTGGLEHFYNYITFLEIMSNCICEDCGKPSKIRTHGWIRTLCLDCARRMKVARPDLEWSFIEK